MQLWTRRLPVAVLLLCGGCFAEPLGIEESGTSGDGPGSSSAAPEGSSTGAPMLGTSSSGSRDTGGSTTTAEDGTTTTGSDDSTTDASTGPVCVAGTLGCGCDQGSCDDGVCRDGLCVESVCGDGLLEGDEACDDGNRSDQDGCEADCTPSPGVAKVVAGDQHSCALFHDGRLRCWGSGAFGKLGYGSLEHVGDDETPASMGDVDVGEAVTDVACGREHTCVLLESGGVRCWGFNNRGQLGIPGPLGDAVGDEPDELPSMLPDVNLGPVPVVELTATSWSTLVRHEDGTVRCFGQNAGFGTCGYGTDEYAFGDDEHPVVEGPVQLGAPAIDIDGHGDHACAVLDDGRVRCWGFNENGALGLGHLDVIGDDEHPNEVPALSFDEPVVEVQTGLRHTCARSESGAVKCWGRNQQGELGLAHADQVDDAHGGPALSLGGAVVDFAVGGHHACALFGGASMRCWGGGNFGRLGYGNVDDVGDDEHPSSQPELELAIEVIHDLDVGNSFSCARVDDGQVLCWGANSAGQIGQPGVSYWGDNETLGGLSPIELED